MIGKRFGRSKGCCAVAVALVAIAASGSLAAQQMSARELFQQALHEEVALGNVQGAIGLYEQVLANGDADLHLKADLRLASLYAKVGRVAEARDRLERLVGADADDLSSRAIVEAARGALARLGEATPHDEPRELREPGFTYSLALDGRRGAFEAIDGKGYNVGVIDYETGAISWITDLEWTKGNGTAFGGIWAPDSRRLAYSQVTPDGITEIRVVVPGETPRVIFRNEGRQTAMVSDWLRDGSALVVSARQDDGSNTLGLVSLRDGSFTQLRTVPWKGFEIAKASLDGRFLLIEEDGDLFLLGTDGSEKVQLTDHPAADADAVWSRDGNHVLFTSGRSGINGLWALPIKDDGRAGTPFLVRAPWDGRLLGWARDELAYAANFNIQNIYTVPVDREIGETTGEAKLIPYPDTGGYLQFPLWSADGREMAFLADASSTSARVVIQPLDGGRAREYRVPENVRYPMTVLRWLPDGTGISFIARNRQDRPILVRGTLADGAWETTPLPQKTNNYAFAWSPTGDSFYYIRGADELPEGSARLIEHHLATGEEEVLHTAEGRIGAMQPRIVLSPDGAELAFDRTGGYRVLSLETGSVRRVAPEWNEGSRSWSPDGWHLPFGCEQNEERGICIVDLGTGNVTTVDLDPDEVLSKTMGTMLEFYAMRDFRLSPAGDRIVFTIHATNRQVMTMADPLAAALEGQPSPGQRR